MRACADGTTRPCGGCRTAVENLAARKSPESAENSQYAIPLAFRKRALFKMDFAEAVYISELRTTPAGHVSYRNVAYGMYEAVARNIRRWPSIFACMMRRRRWICCRGKRSEVGRLVCTDRFWHLFGVGFAALSSAD